MVDKRELVDTCGCVLQRTDAGLHMNDCSLHAAAKRMYEVGQEFAEWSARAVERWEAGDLAEAVRNLDYARKEWRKVTAEIKEPPEETRAERIEAAARRILMLDFYPHDGLLEVVKGEHKENCGEMECEVCSALRQLKQALA